MCTLDGYSFQLIYCVYVLCTQRVRRFLFTHRPTQLLMTSVQQVPWRRFLVGQIFVLLYDNMFRKNNKISHCVIKYVCFWSPQLQKLLKSSHFCSHFIKGKLFLPTSWHLRVNTECSLCDVWLYLESHVDWETVLNVNVWELGGNTVKYKAIWSDRSTRISNSKWESHTCKEWILEEPNFHHFQGYSALWCVLCCGLKLYFLNKCVVCGRD